MSQGQLIDPQTLADMWRCRPQPVDVQPVEASDIVKALVALSDEAHRQMGANWEYFFQAAMAEVLQASGSRATPKRLGTALRAMGLMLWRRNQGYFVAWNAAQVRILIDALGGDIGLGGETVFSGE